MEGRINIHDEMIAGLLANNHFSGHISLSGHYGFEVHRGNKLIDEWDVDNLVTNVGIDDMLEQYFNGSAYTAAHFVSLIDDTGGPAPAITDTMSSHGTWLELSTGKYNEATRPPLTMAAASGKVIATSAASVFTITGADNFGGAFITTDNVKAATDGILFSAAAFGAVRALIVDDVLNVTYSLTGADT